MKIALQLYTVRGDCASNFPETLKTVAKMGYEGVEFAGYYNNSAKELKKMLDDLGLKVAGTHTKLDTLSGDELKKTVEFHHILENKYLIVPSLPEERRNSKSAWMETAKLFNDLAEKVKLEKMHIGYHNHAVEFKLMDGEYPWNLFYGNTNTEVLMQFDTGNAMSGGVTPDGVLDILKKYPGRSKTIHLKEYSSTNKNALIGEGDVKWKEVLSFCETKGGTEWYIIEQESSLYPPIECAKRCLENLKKLIE
jgi:sugar phosphate isomerase/epimerase